MTPSAAPATSNYTLSSTAADERRLTIGTALRRLAPLMAGERRRVSIAFIAVIVTSITSLMAPLIIGRTVDAYIRSGDFPGVLRFAGILLAIYILGLFTTYIQTRTMGMVGRRVLFSVRNALFTKLQELPLAFFNQNKAGDLISRINNDTDKLNQFFAQGLVQLAGNLFLMAGAAIFLVSLSPRLGVAALLPAFGVLVFTRAVSPWVKRANVRSLQSLGGMSGEIQESLTNFKVIVAFNRRDYFREKFNAANERNYAASFASGLASAVFTPIYGLSFNLAQLIVLGYGLTLIDSGQMTVGLLIGFLLYVNSFYLPLRQLATVWATFQLALAGLDRVSAVLALESNMPVLPAKPAESADSTATRSSLLAFEHVGFAYPGGKEVLRDATFALQPGRTYALVGPTGGGKTTTASLMARLYDPSRGRVLLDGRDIRSYQPAERTRKIGFILQEPFLFTGTIRDNVLYGNAAYRDYSNDQVVDLLRARRLDGLLARFESGLETKVATSGDAISLGQKQLIAFIRAVLRDPEILVLDEATANIDTVTEQLLEQILDELPPATTKVIIAHRLNTIANADEIFFINGGEITPAGSMDHALELLLHGKRES
ncbi:MAG: ABC transporter ATP-binding protein [Acidobacteriota bacterium]